MKSIRKHLPVYFILGIGSILVLFPFYLTIVSSFKTTGELSANFFGLPSSLNLENLQTVLGKPGYFSALRNSVVITVVALAAEAILLPMVSYPIARRMNTSKFYRFLYYFMVANIFVPFQVKMMPLAKIMNDLHLLNRTGVTILYIAFSTAEGIFLFVGYLSSIPNDLEEAATIDGAKTGYAFFKIIYPLLSPMTVTVIIKNALWVWNDFFMPTVFLNKSIEYRTLPLFQYTFQGENATQYNLVFAAMLLSMLPMMVIYVVLQKKIIGGLTSGAIKG